MATSPRGATSGRRVCYVGVFPFALAVLGGGLAWLRPREFRAGRFWTGVFAVGLLLALGGQTWRGNPTGHGLYRLAYQFLPGFRSFHDPARCLLWACFALSVLSALGLEAFRRLPRKNMAVACALVAVISFSDLAHFGRTIYPLADAAMLFPTPPAVARLQDDPRMKAHQARYLAPDTARTWQRFSSKRDYRQDAPDYLPFWTTTLTPNLMMSYDLPDAYGIRAGHAQGHAGRDGDGERPVPRGPDRRQASAGGDLGGDAGRGIRGGVSRYGSRRAEVGGRRFRAHAAAARCGRCPGPGVPGPEPALAAPCAPDDGLRDGGHAPTGR